MPREHVHLPTYLGTMHERGYSLKDSFLGIPTMRLNLYIRDYGYIQLN